MQCGIESAPWSIILLNAKNFYFFCKFLYYEQIDNGDAKVQLRCRSLLIQLAVMQKQY